MHNNVSNKKELTTKIKVQDVRLSLAQDDTRNKMQKPTKKLHM